MLHTADGRLTVQVKSAEPVIPAEWRKAEESKGEPVLVSPRYPGRVRFELFGTSQSGMYEATQDEFLRLLITGRCAVLDLTSGT